MGVHVLDVLARPVDAIPEGQGGAAGGRDPRDRRRIGRRHGARAGQARARRCAARGPWARDVLGEMLVFLLRRAGVDPSLLVQRDDVQTSASVLPIRPNGDRPAFHVIGANGTYGAADAPLAEIAEATHLHLGGPEFMGGEDAAKVLAHARANGVTTSADVLAPGDPGLLEWIAPALPELDYLLPNEEQVLGLHRRRRPRGGLPRAGGARGGLRGRDPRRRGRARGGRRRRRGGARVPGRRGGHHRLRRRLLGRLPARPRPRAATAPRRRGWAAPPPRSWRRASAPITAASRSPTCRRCARRRDERRLRAARWRARM